MEWVHDERVKCSLVAVVLLLAPALFGQPQELAAKAQRGQQLMAAHRFAEAAVIYRDLVKALPNNPGLKVNLGMAYHMDGKNREAIPLFEKALELQPGIVPALLFLGAAHLELGEPKKAIPPLLELVSAEPKMKDAHELLGNAFADTGQLDLAARHYRLWASFDSMNPQAWYILGQTYELLSQQAFEVLRDKYPESGYLLALLGDVQLTKKQYSGAFYLYKQALERQPELPGVHASLAVIYTKMDHSDWATIEQARERDLPPPDCSQHKQECDFKKGHYLAVVSAARNNSTAESLYWTSQAYGELARQAYDQLGTLPPSAERYQVEAQIYRNQGRHLQAVKAWRDALKFTPDDPELQRNLAVSLHQSRDDKSALPIFEQLVKKFPNSADFNFMLGDTLLSLQQTEKAIPYLKKSVELDPKLLSGHSSLARALLQLNRGKEAIPHLEVALPTDTDGTLHFQLARAYQLTGQREAARKALMKYREMHTADLAERQQLDKKMTITAP